ncbi:MAG: hypothetical protein A3D35_02975 [Candidatus Staskawiczbacteria bacterium RIFCSPHIGHO2_02_FULL_34_9]|uniref:Uncharacterized protein n=1 Tax=Candidatus Staskawiczbacteria bacterium RIFCSPHIGHO2_02_FULL_34_9 TaxID=1802206 RepID=A0A1G2I461_9BACT|nr:MAG: hypothetical protein A3D35_02975 [Candidatus Staskawiczbacteria bacterium RIFCSPHIGHO2_02_FULL_34_9]
MQSDEELETAFEALKDYIGEYIDCWFYQYEASNNSGVSRDHVCKIIQEKYGVSITELEGRDYKISDLNFQNFKAICGELGIDLMTALKSLKFYQEALSKTDIEIANAIMSEMRYAYWKEGREYLLDEIVIDVERELEGEEREDEEDL